MSILSQVKVAGSNRNLSLIRTEDMDKKTEGYRVLYNLINTTSLASDSYWTYEYALRSNRSKYTIADIAAFYGDIRENANIYHPTGKFISAAINARVGEGEEIVLRNPKIRLDYLGERLYEGRTMIVHGNVGDWAAHFAEGGNMIINGDSGRELSYGMTRGEVIEFGNADVNAAHKMLGGRLIIFGNAGMGLGAESECTAQIIVTGYYSSSITCRAKVSRDPADAIEQVRLRT